MAQTGPEDKKPKEDLFTATGELAHGYEPAQARANALAHAKKKYGEYVGRGKGRRLLLWNVDKAGWDEDAECFSVILSVAPEGANVQQHGSWEYHADYQGNLLPGTPIQRQSLKYTLPGQQKGFPWLPALGAAATVALVGTVGAVLFMGRGASPTPTPSPTPFVIVVPPSTPTPSPTPRPPQPTPVPTATPTPRPTPVPTPTPTAPGPTTAPTPRPTPTALPPTATPMPSPTRTPTATPVPTPVLTPTPTPVLPTPTPMPTPTPIPGGITVSGADSVAALALTPVTIQTSSSVRALAVSGADPPASIALTPP